MQDQSQDQGQRDLRKKLNRPDIVHFQFDQRRSGHRLCPKRSGSAAVGRGLEPAEGMVFLAQMRGVRPVATTSAV